MSADRLFGIIDAVDGINGVRVNDDGSLSGRIVGADGTSHAVVTADIPSAADAGMVIKSSDLADIKALLVEQNQILSAFFALIEDLPNEP